MKRPKKYNNGTLLQRGESVFTLISKGGGFSIKSIGDSSILPVSMTGKGKGLTLAQIKEFFGRDFEII